MPSKLKESSHKICIIALWTVKWRMHSAWPVQQLSVNNTTFKGPDENILVYRDLVKSLSSDNKSNMGRGCFRWGSFKIRNKKRGACAPPSKVAVMDLPSFIPKWMPLWRSWGWQGKSRVGCWVKRPTAFCWRPTNQEVSCAVLEVAEGEAMRRRRRRDKQEK